ncbi:hypothetical protein [Halomonas alimentaria]|uniref:Uncharacterized protein n=1 Tax=Halomonas alimentaria TaxID=147248 RepID=A0A7X4W3J5_9GAMM|nr:hypothetical protein [Halomonas alimentaria]NAW33742.1 hypothetical protein [Halomonas alimentaria]
MKFLYENWNWISSNAWVATGFALLFFGLGWGSARILYHERLELLKAKSGSAESQPPSTSFTYPQFGRHGKNVLANTTTNVVAEEWVSLRAEIPVNSELHVEMCGPQPEYLDDTEGSWMYSIGHVINWTASEYDFSNGGKQCFDAEGGIADMKLRFTRAGVVKISAYEGGAQRVTWERTFNVVQARSKNA